MRQKIQAARMEFFQTYGAIPYRVIIRTGSDSKAAIIEAVNDIGGGLFWQESQYLTMEVALDPPHNLVDDGSPNDPGTQRSEAFDD